MDPSKLVTSRCMGHIWGLYSILVMFLGVIASISGFPTGSVITQASLPDGDQSSPDSPSRRSVLGIYAGDLKVTLNSLREDFIGKRLRHAWGDSPIPLSEVLNKLPDINELLPSTVISSEAIPTRMWTHYWILHAFNRSMDNFRFDESQNNASNNFGTRFDELQNKIERVMGGILQTFQDRSWEENESVTVSHNLDDIFKTVYPKDFFRDLRICTLLSFFDNYASILNTDVQLLR